ncbi:hypothetical protein FOA43_001308 [Brettanomyces nanus]|uniref:CUE domain-containing protein n=1 Tax=Eeniella nana TaxID=13502 RepID=A0A875RX50_EENNA|nr:uncharacterized protein FOA43_001308 [Brettanomyces nanus]QPG73991.1 hypothetical protein FOA43_001308 [Brettanomyces nanus]
MGISGLLPVLKPIQDKTTLERYRGKTLAVDTYAWLHKAAFSCSMQLVLDQPTSAYIDYIIRRLAMFQHFGITAYMVLDGDYLPSKGNTEADRCKRREEYRQKALNALKDHNKRLAMNYCQKACDITPEMAKSLIEELKKRQIRYVVAPYEADSQLVYLENKGLVDGIVSEDSDLLVFGCQTLITKLNDRGECIEIQRCKFKLCRATALSCLSQPELQLMAIISGCDYTRGISGLGVQKAAALVKRFKTLDRIIMALKFEGKITVPDAFSGEYKRASIAFKHPIVFDPVQKLPVHLHPIPKDSEEVREYVLSCTGQVLDAEIHCGVANGDLNPFTKLPLVSREAKFGFTRTDKKSRTLKKSTSLPIPSLRRSFSQRNTLDKYSGKSLGGSKGTIDSSPYRSRKHAIFTIDHFIKRLSDSTKRGCEDAADNESSLVKRSRILEGGSSQNEERQQSKFFKSDRESRVVIDSGNAYGNADGPSDFVDLNSSEFVVSDPEDEGKLLTENDKENILGKLAADYGEDKLESVHSPKVIKRFALKDITNEVQSKRLKRELIEKSGKSTSEALKLRAQSTSVLTSFGFHGRSTLTLYLNWADGMDTEQKLEVISERFPEVDKSELLEILVACDGSIERTEEMLDEQFPHKEKKPKRKTRELQDDDVEKTETGGLISDMKSFKRRKAGTKIVTLYTKEEIESLFDNLVFIRDFLPEQLAEDMATLLMSKRTLLTPNEFYIAGQKCRSSHRTGIFKAELDSKRPFSDVGNKEQNSFFAEMKVCRYLVEDQVNLLLAERKPLATYQVQDHWQGNLCIANMFENSKQQLDWHSDKLTSIGPLPVIASVSLGATRIFRVKKAYASRESKINENSIFNIPLPHNSLLVMLSGTQEEYKHCVPSVEGCLTRNSESTITLTDADDFVDNAKLENGPGLLQVAVNNEYIRESSQDLRRFVEQAISQIVASIGDDEVIETMKEVIDEKYEYDDDVAKDAEEEEEEE